MYSLVEVDYSLPDVERFVELSIRRGIGFASLEKSTSGANDVRIAAGAALLGLKPNAPIDREALQKRLCDFLGGPGDWLAESVDALEAKLLALGLIEEADGHEARAFATHSPDETSNQAKNQTERFIVRLEPRPGVTATRLIDELEAAREVLAARRAARRATLQAKNREVNSGAPIVDAALDQHFMRLALDAAKRAAEAGEVPVGAVLVANEAVLAVTNNRTLRDRDPSAHAEMLALREGAKKLGNHRLSETTLYVTLEPCPMCAGAIAEARCRRIVFGAADPRRGAVTSALRLFELPGVNHRPFVSAGLFEAEAAALLRDFFAERRQKSQDAVENTPENGREDMQ